MFGTMILQIPVNGGHQGGHLVLEHSGKTKKFSFDNGSDQKFFLTAFYADCEHQLEQVTQGWRLTLVFNLVWKNGGVPALRAPVDVPVLLEVLKEIKESLRPWVPGEDQVVTLPSILAGKKMLRNMYLKSCI